MNKRQAAKLAALAATVATIAPQVMPFIPPQYHGLAGGLLALFATLGAGAMQSPLAPKPAYKGTLDVKTKPTMFPTSGK